jgi:hypothetical protein
VHTDLLKPGSQNGSANGHGAVDTVTVELATTTEVPGALDMLASEPAEADRQQASGGIAAALLSAGFGCALFGFIVTLAEANPGVKDALILSQPTGSLSGKSTVAIACWLAVWPLLHWRLKDREVNLRGALRLTWMLVAFGVLATFPPFYNLFAAPG